MDTQKPPLPALTGLETWRHYEANSVLFFFSWRQGVWPPTFSGNILNLDLMFMGHVAKDGEDGKPRNKTGHTVDGAGQQGIPGRERERQLLAMQVP